MAIAIDKVSDEDLKKLADLIVENIKSDFNTKYLSKNLIKTIQIENSVDGLKIIIPAKTYNMITFQKQGVIVHNGHGSYASKLNEIGSEFFTYSGYNRKGSKKITPHNHIGYVDRAISSALLTWKNMMSEKYKFVSMKEM